MAIGKKVVLIQLILLCMTVLVWAGGEQEGPGLEAVSPWEGQTVNVVFMAAANVIKFENLISDFEQRYGAKVVLDILTQKNFNEKVILELAANKGAYDVVWAVWGSYHQYMDSGWFTPLEPFLNNSDLVDEDLLDFESFSADIVEGLKFNGKQMSLPIFSDTGILHYRTDVFSDHGIGTPPDTWDEFTEIAAKIHSDEVAAAGFRTSKAQGGVGYYFSAILKSLGGSIVKDFPTDMTPNLTHPDSVAAIKWFRDVTIKYGYPGMRSAHYMDQMINIQQGKVAMMPEGNGNSGQILDPEKSTVVGKIGFALIPKGKGGREGMNAHHGLGIPANSQNKDLGYKFLEWALSPEIQLENSLKNHTTVVNRPKLMLNSEYQELFDWGNGEWAKVASESLAKYTDPLSRPMNPQWKQVDEIFSNAMNIILTSDDPDVETVLEDANKAIAAVYREAGLLK